MTCAPTLGLDPGELLRQMFDAGIAAVQPSRIMAGALPPRPAGRIMVLGAGKASATMAAAAEEALLARGDDLSTLLPSLVVTRTGHAVPCRRIEIVEAAHPVPDAAGLTAARRMLAMVQGLTADDQVIVLISGGASALLPAPPDGVSLADKQDVTQALLRSGASIHEINAVRKHLSLIKGGRLAAAAYPAQVVTLALSDVPGDDPATIGSGPTVADPSDFAAALDVIARYRLTLPPSVAAYFERAVHDPAQESPKPGDPRLAGGIYRCIGTATIMLEAAATVARAAGVTPVVLGDAIEGEAVEVGRVLAGIALAAARSGHPAPPPLVILSGGETSVTLPVAQAGFGGGRGGRNSACLLAAGIALQDHPRIWGLFADSDGIDGSETNAGAIWQPGLLAAARARGLDPLAYRDRCDSFSFFATMKALMETGPTLTNVNDFRALLVLQ